MSEEDIAYRIRPSGRHLLTIGRELIQDQYAAIVELVKNAFDADSPSVVVKFEGDSDGGFQIVVEDLGHGMTKDTVVNKWLVPSTDDKQKRSYSPSGRRMQGRKGIGRYASALLGDDLLLETVDTKGNKTTVLIEWKRFETAAYLSEVPILIESEETDLASGTTLTITAREGQREEWTEKQVDKLRFELRKMIPPPFKEGGDEASEIDFQIKLVFDNFLEGLGGKQEFEIQPYEIFEFFDYRIYGQIGSDGNGQLTFVNQKAKNTANEKIDVSVGQTRCGGLTFDIRVFDRDPAAIASLIQRGLKGSDGAYLGKNQTKNLLNTLNGISVVRNDFRIRPLGDADFDWLKLNKDRIQNPSMRVSDNQVIGYVRISPEEDSNLYEKSARDGLKENDAYFRLIEITRDYVLSELETRRFMYRKSEGLGRKNIKLEHEIDQLFLFRDLADEISSTLEKSKVSKPTIEKIVGLVEADAEEKNLIAEDIKKTVALYQGQATLGKIVNVLMHEGRKPLSFFRNQIKNLDHYGAKLRIAFDQEVFEKLTPITDGLSLNATHLVALFDRINPLAAKARGARKDFSIVSTIQQAKLIYENTLKSDGIKCEIVGSERLTFFGWQQDLLTIFVNLIENSIFWVNEKGDCAERCISISVFDNNGVLEYIDVADSGKGIEASLLESEVIFDPEFSTKPGERTGLGLAIAGEAATRLGIKLAAIDCDDGALFRLTPKGAKNDDD